MEYVSIIVSAIASIAVAYIGANTAKNNKIQENFNRNAEEAAKLRERENRLQMEMLDATLQLSIVSANALTHNANNGNIEKARTAADDARKAYTKFLKDVVAHETAK